MESGGNVKARKSRGKKYRGEHILLTSGEKKSGPWFPEPAKKAEILQSLQGLGGNIGDRKVGGLEGSDLDRSHDV